jgi:hypothetical protein
VLFSNDAFRHVVSEIKYLIFDFGYWIERPGYDEHPTSKIQHPSKFVLRSALRRRFRSVTSAAARSNPTPPDMVLGDRTGLL